jgi:competence protein ComEC
MRKGTIVLLVIIVIVALVVLATIKPVTNPQDRGTQQATSIRTLYNDSTTATIGLNGTASGQTLGLNGAVLRIGELASNGTVWSVSWTVGPNAWQGSVQKLGDGNLSATVIDQDNDRKMGPNDRIQIRRGTTEGGVSLEMVLGLRFAGGQQANCTFTFSHSNGSATVVSFINVGQGDSILISTADHREILIDAGPPLAAGALISYLNNRSISIIDALIVTHPDSDHLGGAADVLRDFTVLSVFHPGVAKNTSAYSSFIHAAQAEGCPVHTAADTHPGGYLNITASATIEVLNIDPTAQDVNDASIVLEMRTPGKSFLFTGDIDSEVEGRLIANHSFNLDVDVLKVGHHGSRYSTSNAFLDATSRETAVICVGVNTYGHPTNETLSRLSAHDVTVLRTDQMGTVDIAA